MDLKEFQNRIKESLNIKENFSYYDNQIVIYEDDSITLNGKATDFTDPDDVVNFIENERLVNNASGEVVDSIYENLSEDEIVNTIRKYSDEKITNTTINEYVDLAKSKIFTGNSIVDDIRINNEHDRVSENKLLYILNDDSTIAIEGETVEYINRNMDNLDSRETVIAFMQENQENFMEVLQVLIEGNQ